MPGLKLVVITGLSGAGKSHALKCFEDVGYFCIDNLPPALLPTFVELCHQQGGEIKNVALGIDIRERVFFADLTGILQRIKDLGHSVELLFLEARDAVLVRRFSESRRPHPLLPELPVLEGVRFEKERLSEIRSHADRIIDTSNFSVHESTGSAEPALQPGASDSSPDHFAHHVRVQVRSALRHRSPVRRAVFAQSVFCSGSQTTDRGRSAGPQLRAG